MRLAKRLVAAVFVLAWGTALLHFHSADPGELHAHHAACAVCAVSARLPFGSGPSASASVAAPTELRLDPVPAETPDARHGAKSPSSARAPPF